METAKKGWMASMRDKLIEESVLFVSVLKWVFLASTVGLIVGLSTAVFLKLLDGAISWASSFSHYFLFLPLALFLSALLVRRWEPESGGYGPERVIEAVHKKSGKINLAVVPTKLTATILTAAAGGSVGQVGPCAQIGAALASASAGFIRLDDDDRKKLVICGISAGFASVLGAPIAGAIFGVEVLTVGSIMYEVLLPSFVAGITGYHVSSLLGITYLHIPLKSVPPLSESFIFVSVVAGILFGLCSVLFIEAMRLGEKVSAQFPSWDPLKGLAGGVILILLALAFSTDYMGLGVKTIHDALQGDLMPWYAFPLKAITTSVTFACGGTGGIIAPMIFAGTMAGNLFGHLLGLDPGIFAAMGFVGVLAGAANTPIAMSILAVELFGSAVAPYAAVVCIVSFLMTGHRGIFATQRLTLRKSASMEVETGKEIGDVRAGFRPRKKSVIGTVMNWKKKTDEKDA